MPREQITFAKHEMVTGPHLSDGTPDPESSHTTMIEPELHVHWSPAAAGGHVQMSLEVDVEWATRLVDDAAADDRSRITIYAGVLTRAEINRAITILRRARDRAYGKDS